MTLFKCTRCDEKFKAPNIEYCATTYCIRCPSPARCVEAQGHAGKFVWKTDGRGLSGDLGEDGE